MFINEGAGNFPNLSPNDALLVIPLKSNELSMLLSRLNQIHRNPRNDKRTHRAKQMLMAYQTRMKKAVLRTAPAEIKWWLLLWPDCTSRSSFTRDSLGPSALSTSGRATASARRRWCSAAGSNSTAAAPPTAPRQGTAGARRRRGIVLGDPIERRRGPFSPFQI